MEDSFTLDTITPRQVDRLELMAAMADIYIQAPPGKREELLVAAVETQLGTRFEVHCKLVVPYESLHILDQSEGPPSVYVCENASTYVEALDEFHEFNPIKTLDHYHIQAIATYTFPKP